MVVLELIITALTPIFLILLFGSFSYLLSIRRPFPTLNITMQLKQYPKVSIILPVRNEEKRIARALESIKELQYPNLEAIVVDGSSEDRTKEIALRYGFTIVDEGQLPEGWIGKVWGCWVGANSATGEILLFTDADVRHGQNSLKLCVEHMLSNQLEALTVLTYQEARSFWERIMSVTLFMIFIASGGSRLSNDPRSSASIGNGQYFAFTRDCYLSIGGHKTVRENIVEDVALASELKRRRRRFQILGQPNIASTRMYPGGLKEIWEGWTKNLYRGASLFGPTQRLAVLMILLLGLGSPLYLMLGVIVGSLPTLTLGSLGYLLLSISLIKFSRKLGEYPWYYALIYPVGMVLFVATLTYSYLRDKTGKGVIWKGRTYKRRP